MSEGSHRRSPLSHDEFIGEFARHSRQLYGYIRSLVPVQSDADDVYQATCLVMWRKASEYEVGSNFFAWGCQIARFEVRKLRELGKRTHMFSEEAIDALAAALAARREDTSSRLAALANCVEKLTPTSKWLIHQRYFVERSAGEIAAELGKSISSVYRDLSRAHGWLLDCIERTLAREN